MAIQVLKPKYHVEECLEQIRECLEIGWTGMGFKTVEFKGVSTEKSVNLGDTPMER